MRRVEIESPYSGDVAKNLIYARRCMKDSLLRGEAPIASHLLYTQMLDDTIPAERTMGMEAGKAWSQFAEAVIIYTDLGISSGMQWGIDAAIGREIPVEYRTLDE